VAYTPDWEPLADALRRAMASGIAEDEAKIDLCRAVADRKINVRVRIASGNDYDMQGEVFSRGNVAAPPHLSPGDLDWIQSRPLRQWLIGPVGPENYHWFGGWKKHPIDLIELSTHDVLNIFDQRRQELRPRIDRRLSRHLF
jgi:hypothetical protein